MDGAEDSDKRRLENEKVDPKTVPFWTSARFALALLGFFGYVVLYALKANLSVAIVCMLNYTAINELKEDKPGDNVTVIINITNEHQCGSDGATNKTKISKDGEFVWNAELQGLILSSFFWGYLVTQVPGGWMSEKFGSKLVWGWFMFATIIASFFMPIAARISPILFIILRIIQGLGEGVVWPATSFLWARWAPPLERSRLVGFTFAGAQIGNVIAMPVSALLCDYGFAGGWPSIFYVFGIIGMVWWVLWMFLVAETPAVHPRISDIERRYINQCLGNLEEVTKKRRAMGTPWRAIFRSKAVMAICVGHACANWGSYLLLTNMPTYMKQVLHFDIKSNGTLSAIPYIVFWAMINVASVIADKLRIKGIKTVTVRKISFAIGNIVPAFFLVITGFVPCEHPFIAVAMLTLSVGFCGFQYPGCFVNHADIAAPFAGILFGLSNSCATIPGIIAPYLVGVLTPNKTQEEWRVVFYISAVIYVIGAVVFGLFAQGEPREWVKPYLQCRPSQEDEEKAIALAANGAGEELQDIKPTFEVGTNEEKTKLA